MKSLFNMGPNDLVRPISQLQKMTEGVWDKEKFCEGSKDY